MGTNAENRTWEAVLVMAVATALPSWPVALGVFAIFPVILVVAVWMG